MSRVPSAVPVVTDDDGRASLPTPPEPLEVRDVLRRTLLDGADWVASFGAGLGIADGLWESWSPVLEPAGLDRDAFDSVVSGYRREVWFWVLGDRRWEQVVSGLAGRARRRLPET